MPPVARSQSHNPLVFLIAFPLLIIPFAVYNIIAFLLDTNFNTTIFTVPLLSGTSMSVSSGDMLIIVGVLLLYIEIVKSTRMSSKAITDHVLSLILFMAMTIEFMVVQKAATSVFLILVTLSFVDVIGGFSITIRTSQRDVNIESAERMLG